MNYFENLLRQEKINFLDDSVIYADVRQINKKIIDYSKSFDFCLSNEFHLFFHMFRIIGNVDYTVTISPSTLTIISYDRDIFYQVKPNIQNINSFVLSPYNEFFKDLFLFNEMQTKTYGI
jgi:hypothetical protein